MAKATDDSKRCPECRSTNLRLVSTRDHRAPNRGDGMEPPVVARTLVVQCGRCKAQWSLLRRVSE